MLLREHLIFYCFDVVLVAIRHERLQVFACMYGTPVERCFPAYNSQSSPRRELSIHVTHSREQLLFWSVWDGAEPKAITPHLAQLINRNVISGNVAIDLLLVAGVGLPSRTMSLTNFENFGEEIRFSRNSCSCRLK